MKKQSLHEFYESQCESELVKNYISEKRRVLNQIQLKEPAFFISKEEKNKIEKMLEEVVSEELIKQIGG